MTDAWFDNGVVRLYQSDARSLPIPDNSVDCVVTSPPYWGLRDYGIDEQGIGLEPTPEEYCANMVEVFREVWRVLKPTGTLWLNLGDVYAHSGASGGASPDGPRKPRATDREAQLKIGGTMGAGRKPKDLVGIPWRVAFALQADGWYLRSDIIWSKPNPMPESVTDRPTKAHEYVFLLTKSPKYYYDADAIREKWADDRHGMDGSVQPSERNRGGRTDGFTKPNGIDPSRNGGRNKRTIWEITTAPFSDQICQRCRTHYTSQSFSRLRNGNDPMCDTQLENGEMCNGIRFFEDDGYWVCAACDTGYMPKQLKRLPKTRRCRVCKREDGWISHFATFPIQLPILCIKAGTSEWGVCPTCGAPWERTLERTDDRHRTAGWQPTCKHNTSPVPATVLDPFAGACTTMLAARKLNRASVGIDLNNSYLDMGIARTLQGSLL